MGKEDIRIFRTKRLLFDAFIDLLENKDLSSISIKNICDIAMVNRTTFYRHFENKGDLLERGASFFIDSIIKNLKFNPNSKNPLKERLLALFKDIKKRSRILTSLLGPRIPNIIYYNIQKQIENYLYEERVLPIYHYKEPNLNVAAFSKMTASVLTGIIKYWLMEVPGEKPEIITDLYYKYVSGAFNSVMDS